MFLFNDKSVKILNVNPKLIIFASNISNASVIDLYGLKYVFKFCFNVSGDTIKLPWLFLEIMNNWVDNGLFGFGVVAALNILPKFVGIV